MPGIIADERICGECWKKMDHKCFNENRYACDDCSKKVPPQERRHIFSRGVVHRLNLDDELLKLQETSRPSVMCLKCVVIQKELETQAKRIVELEDEVRRLRTAVSMQKNKKKESLSGVDRIHDGDYFVSDARNIINKIQVNTDVDDLPSEYLPRWILKRLMATRALNPLLPGENGMQHEFEYYGTDEDRENWKYVMNEAAGTRKDGRDKGHEGYRLDDFWAQAQATGAGLTKMEVASLRLFTGPSGKSINRALRERTKQFETTIYNIATAVQKLQMWQNQSWDGLYRGLRGMEGLLDKVKGDGWMDMGDLPLLYDLPAAIETSFVSATKIPIESNSSDPFLVGRIKTAQSIGASLAWVSQYPEDDEVLFCPGIMLVANPKCYRIVGRSASTQKGRITYTLELPVASRELDLWVIQPTSVDLPQTQPPLLRTPEDLCNY